MRYARQLMRAAQDVSIPTGNAIPAPKYWQPASKAPSPTMHMIIGCGVGLVFAGYYKMAYWSWKKEVNQFYHDYNKVMAEEGPGAQ